MADEEIQEGEFYTLTDEDGKESKFELIGSYEMDGKMYFALIPEGEQEEYVILRQDKDEDGEDCLVTIDDDDEFDRVADVFDDELFSDVDYDAGAEDQK